jgi:ATP-binding protein involved in chromosome partitioning
MEVKGTQSMPTSVNRDTVLEALQRVQEREVGTDIVSLGLVKDIEIDDASVYVEIELTTPLLSDKGRIEREAKEQIGSVAGVSEVTVHVSPLLRRRDRGQEKTGLGAVKNIVAVASGKGGVGKSTVAAGLAKTLAQRGYKVGLLDTDIYGPSVPSLFELTNVDVQATEDEMVLPVSVDGLKLMSFGFLLGEAPAVMRGPMVSRYIQQFLHDVQWHELDYLFLDLPPGTGDVQLTITQSVNIEGAVIVTTPQALSFADVGKAILMFDKVNVPILGVVENMAYFQCPDCGSRHSVFGEGAAQRLVDRFGTTILGELPLAHEQYGTHFKRSVEDPSLNELANNTLLGLGRHAMGVEVPNVDYDDQQITLSWSNGEKLSVSNFELRANCQCAVCVDEFDGTRKIGRDDIKKDIKPEDIKPIGNYALYIKWNDGHQSGFFPYRLIREVAEGARS